MLDYLVGRKWFHHNKTGPCKWVINCEKWVPKKKILKLSYYTNTFASFIFSLSRIWWLKFSFSCEYKPRCFWQGVPATGELLKVTTGWKLLWKLLLWKHHILNLFRQIRIKRLFPLIGPIWDLFYVLIKWIIVNIMNNGENRCISSK